MTNQSTGSASRGPFARLSLYFVNFGDRNLSSLLEGSRRGLAWARGIVSFAAVVMLVGTFCTPAHPQTLQPSWYLQSPATSPSARWDGAQAYDSAHSQVVIFGGFGAGTPDETWLWNGTNWSQANPATVPTGLTNQAMAYDALHGQVVMFGGANSSSTRLNETWLWNGTNWNKASPVNSPPARNGAAMVYDAALGEVVLFGGVNAGGSIIGDTWLWNGTNWTNANPATSPTARIDHAMAYDAAHGQVVLFGGFNGSYLNDTWAWDGTNWAQQSPATSPGVRYGEGMDYDAAQGQVVMFGGFSGSAYLNDTWTWNGTNWTQQSPATSPSPSYALNAMTYDGAHGGVVMFGGYDGGSVFSDTWVWETPQNFGDVNVCPSGQTTPSPCSRTLPLTFNFAADTPIGSIQIVTQGASGLDFTQANGGNCSGTIFAGNSCTLDVTFTPLAPGLRLGAVQFFDNSQTLLTSTAIYGVGQGPAVAFVPGTQTTVNTGSYVLNQPKGVAVNAAGDVFIEDTGSHTANHNVVKVAANGTTVVASGLGYPQGIAVDGAGNLFIADNDHNQVVKVTPGGVQTNMNFGLVAQLGVAVDGAGDLFVGDFTESKVVKAPAGCTSSACATVVYVPEPGFHPVGLAVDAAGDLFIADYADTPPGKVVEIPAGCTNSSCQITVGTGWSEPEAVAVDAAGDVFVADEAPKVVEVPAGCTNTGCEIPISGVLAYGIAVDGKGNIFLPDIGSSDPTINQVIVLNRAQPPSLSFASTNVGSTSGDSPKSITVQNIGNQTLDAIGPGLVVNGPNFVEVVGPGTPADCSNTFALTPGEECNLSISFEPLSGGNPLTSSAVFTDNALNANPATQTIALSGVGVTVVPTTVTVPNVVGLTQDVATTSITAASLVLGTVSTASSSTVPLGSVISQNPVAPTPVNLGSAVNLVVSSGVQAAAPNPLTLQNNYFVTGDYVAAGVTLRGTGTGGIATGSINIPSSATGGNQGVPDGADIIEAFLYWETVESTPTASGGSGTFDKFPITGQQIGTDLPNPDGSSNGTLRVYRADVNAYFMAQPNGIRSASGTHSVSLPDSGGSGFPLTEGASLVVIYRVLSPNFPLKAVVIYDGSALSAGTSTQLVKGFYDAVGGTTGESTNLFATAGGSWNTSTSSVQLPTHASQYSATLGSNSAYAAVILSTPVTNSDNDGILDVWKTGPTGPSEFHTGQPGYYDVKTGSWVPLPGAQHGQRDLFVQLDYMCGTVNPDGSCSGENLFPSPDSNGNDPLAMVQQAFAANGVHLHLEVGNAVQEDSCTDSGSQLCQFPGQSGVISWKNSLEFSKLWPRNLTACASGGDCTARFPYGQKDSYHYVLFGHSLAIPAWDTRYGTLTSIKVAGGVTTIVTADRGSGINACPSRITISGVLGNANLNGVYNTAGCTDSKTITVNTPGVPSWNYPNTTLPEPIIGLTSGSITSISGYSDLGGADSAVTLGLWLTAPNQDMSKRANVIAGTLFHEIGHTLGLGHGGLYYDSSNYVPTFEANCKPNYQSSMNYLFQLDGVGPNRAVAFSNQTLTSLDEDTAGSVTQLTDPSNAAATFSTSAWYVPYVSGVSGGSPATLHCDGTPLTGIQAYRVNAPIAPITPAWSNGQDINFDGQDNATMRGYNDWANIDLRQVGATGGEFASLASVLSFGSSTPQNIPVMNGTVALGSGGTVTLGSGGTVALGSGGTVTLGSGGTITLGSGGNVTLGSGGTVTLGSGGTVTPGTLGTVALGSGGTVTINGSGTITDGGTITQVSSTGGTYSIGSGGIIALGSGGTVTLGSGGTVTLGSGGIVALGSGGTVALGSGGTVTLGSGGIVALGSGGTVTLGSGGTVTLGSGGTVTLGSGGAVSGSGGTVALGSGGTVTLGSGGTVTLGSGGTVALGSGGTVTLGSGGTIALGSGGTVALGSGGTVTLGSGGTITQGSGGIPMVVGPGTYSFSAGGTITLGSGGTIALGSGGDVTLGSSGGTITLGSGGTIALGSGGTVTLGSGGTVTLGSGGIVALGSGGTVALGSGGTVALGSGGTIALGSGGIVALGSGGTVTLGSGGSLSTELTYETANSIVRPPSSPTETPTPAGVRIDWTAPAFGVVGSYTIYRSSDGATPIVIGTVTGNPPATEFIDINPDTTSATVVYTIATNLAPVPIDPTTRQSAPSAPAVLKNDQTITLGALPVSVLVSGPQPTVTATAMSNGSPNGLQVNFSTTGPCAIVNQSITNGVSSATVALNNTGSCTIIASQSGATSYNAARSVSGGFPILPQTAAQTITFTIPPPPSAAFKSSFTVAATGGASGNPVTFTSSGVCTVSGATYTMTSSTGTCSVIANQAGNSTYVAATPLTLTVNATGPLVTVSPSSINFGTVYQGRITTKTITVTNIGNAPVTINQPLISIVHGGNSNEFVSVNLCPSSVAAGKSCTITISFVAGPYYTPQTATLEIMDNAPGSPQPVTLSATVLIPQTIAFTTSPPASAAYKTSFTVAATGGASGNAVKFTSSGACSNSGATYTMTSGSGMCSVIANQAGNSTYAAAAQVTKTVTATRATQTITFTTNPPASAAYKTSFTVGATGGASGNAVTFTSSGSCSNAGATYTMSGGTGTCSVIANQAGNSNYAAAAAVTRTVNATYSVASLSPTSLSFGTVSSGKSSSPKAVTLSNTGATPLIINSIGFTGANPGNFVQTNTCPGPSSLLAAGKSCTISVTFNSSGKAASANLTVIDNTQVGTQTVSLSGN